MEGELEFLRELLLSQEAGQRQGALTGTVLTSHPGNSPGSHQLLSSTPESSLSALLTQGTMKGPLGAMAQPPRM